MMERVCKIDRANLGYCQSPLRHFKWVHFLCHYGQDSQVVTVVSLGDYR